MQVDIFLVTIVGAVGSGKTTLWENMKMGLENKYKAYEITRVTTEDDSQKEIYKIEILK